MSKGGYAGGSSVVGFSGSFAGTRMKKLAQATNLDTHVTQKTKRDEARKAAGWEGTKKNPPLSKAERRAENKVRIRNRDVIKKKS